MNRAQPLQHLTDTTTDTHPEANEVQLRLIRSMPPVRHIQRTVELSGQLKSLLFAALQRVHPSLGEAEIRLLYIEQVYGKRLADGVRGALAEREEQVSTNNDLTAPRAVSKRPVVRCAKVDSHWCTPSWWRCAGDDDH